MHSWLSLPFSTCWWWEETQREVEKRRYSRISCCVDLKTQIQWIPVHGNLKNWDWTLPRETPEIPRMHMVQNRIRERKRAILRHYPNRWISWAKSLRAWRGGTTTWGNFTTSKLYLQSSVEFCEKIYKLKPKITTFHSLVKTRETQIVCLLCIRDAQCGVRGDLNSDLKDTLRRSKTPWATFRVLGSVNRLSTSFFFMITLLENASDSIAS